MKAASGKRQEAVPVVVSRTEEGDGEAGERLHGTARRLYPGVAWERMSEQAVRRAFGLPPPGCQQREEYEAGRQARAEGALPGSGASMAFRIGWGHGKPPRSRRRRWRPRPQSTASGRVS